MTHLGDALLAPEGGSEGLAGHDQALLPSTCAKITAMRTRGTDSGGDPGDEGFEREATDPDGVRYRIVVRPRLALASPAYMAGADGDGAANPLLRAVNSVLIRMQGWKTVPQGAWLSVIPAVGGEDAEYVDFMECDSVGEAQEHSDRLVRSITTGTHGYA